MDKEEAKKTAVELQAFADDLKGKFDALAEKHERTMRIHRFFSDDPTYFWRMPRWLWIPLVAALVLLLVAALLAVRLG